MAENHESPSPLFVAVVVDREYSSLTKEVYQFGDDGVIQPDSEFIRTECWIDRDGGVVTVAVAHQQLSLAVGQEGTAYLFDGLETDLHFNVFTTREEAEAWTAERGARIQKEAHVSLVKELWADVGDGVDCVVEEMLKLGYNERDARIIANGDDALDAAEALRTLERHPDD